MLCCGLRAGNYRVECRAIYGNAHYIMVSVMSDNADKEFDCFGAIIQASLLEV